MKWVGLDLSKLVEKLVGVVVLVLVLARFPETGTLNFLLSNYCTTYLLNY